jgi:hypothetical protein
VTVALSDASTITVSVVGFFALLVIVALTRAVLRRDAKPYKRYRLGVFVERDDGPKEDE